MAVADALRLVGSTVAIYVFLVVVLRLTGNRTLAKLRAFDFVVTIAIGSIVGSVAVEGDGPSLAKGAAAIGLLVGLQFGASALAAASPRFHRLLASDPRLVLYDGKYLSRNLRKAHLTREDVRIAMRREGLLREDECLAAILETNGDVVVVPRGERVAKEEAPGGVGGLHGR